ncbi:sensor histidine kinase [Kitasatospora sp. NPDC001159]
MHQPSDHQPESPHVAGHPQPSLSEALPGLPVRLPKTVVALAPTVILLLVFVPLALTNGDTLGPSRSAALDATLIAIGSLALAFRRRAPVAVAVLTLLSGTLPLAIALYELAARRGTTRTLAVLAVFAEIRLLIPFDFSDFTTLSAFAGIVEDPLVYGVVPLALGVAAHQRTRAVGVLVERNRLLEEAHQYAEERAAAAERARLAREMHDVVSNRVSLITLHAGAAQVAQTDDPDAVRQTLGLIRTLGLQALTELRGLLGVLTPAPDQVPSLRGLPALVDESRQAGLTVDLIVTGPPPGQPAPGPAVQYAAYRIVQEALTNAHKHAPDAEVTVTVEINRDDLHVAVVNAPGGTGGETELPSGGHGLDGMRTRADDLGGTLGAGPTPDGGFAVHARLPLVGSEA